MTPDWNDPEFVASLKSGACDHDIETGEPIWPGHDEEGINPVAAARIVDDIEASPRTLADYWIESCGDPNVDPTAGKSWRGEAFE